MTEYMEILWTPCFIVVTVTTQCHLSKWKFYKKYSCNIRVNV